MQHYMLSVCRGCTLRLVVGNRYTSNVADGWNLGLLIVLQLFISKRWAQQMLHSDMQMRWLFTFW
jgi:hypothetical protein